MVSLSEFSQIASCSAKVSGKPAPPRLPGATRGVHVVLLWFALLGVLFATLAWKLVCLTGLRSTQVQPWRPRAQPLDHPRRHPRRHVLLFAAVGSTLIRRWSRASQDSRLECRQEHRNHRQVMTLRAKMNWRSPNDCGWTTFEPTAGRTTRGGSRSTTRPITVTIQTHLGHQQ